MLQLNNMINGKLVPSESGEKIEVFNPFNQEVVGTVPKSTKKRCRRCTTFFKESTKRMGKNTGSKKRRISFGNCRTDRQT